MQRRAAESGAGRVGGHVSAVPLTPHMRAVLASVADGSCFVALSNTLLNLRDLGLIEPEWTRPRPWYVTPLGFATLAIGEVVDVD